MFVSAKADILTNASGDATVYLAPSVNVVLNGFILELTYTPGNLDTGADLTITIDGTERPIMTKSNAGTTKTWFMPRAVNNAVADGAAATSNSELIPIKNDRIKVVVAQGGNAKSGSIEVLVLVNPPY